MPLHKTSRANFKKKSTLKFGPKLYLQYRLKNGISSQFVHGLIGLNLHIKQVGRRTSILRSRTFRKGFFFFRFYTPH